MIEWIKLNLKDIILILAQVFTAIGTVGAVVLALSREKQKIRISYMEHFHTTDEVLSYDIISCGFNPTKVIMVEIINCGVAPVIISNLCYQEPKLTISITPYPLLTGEIPKLISRDEVVRYIFEEPNHKKAGWGLEYTDLLFTETNDGRHHYIKLGIFKSIIRFLWHKLRKFKLERDRKR